MCCARRRCGFVHSLTHTRGQVILAQRPDVNITNKIGQTALFYAVAMDRPNMVTFLVAACGALVKNVKDKSGNTPLHFASNEAIAKTLLQHGATVNTPNIQGNTPLHCAFAFGGPAVADLMLSAGGDITKKVRLSRMASLGFRLTLVYVRPESQWPHTGRLRVGGPEVYCTALLRGRSRVRAHHIHWCQGQDQINLHGTLALRAAHNAFPLRLWFFPGRIHVFRRPEVRRSAD